MLGFLQLLVWAAVLASLRFTLSEKCVGEAGRCIARISVQLPFGLDQIGSGTYDVRIAVKRD